MTSAFRSATVFHESFSKFSGPKTYRLVLQFGMVMLLAGSFIQSSLGAAQSAVMRTSVMEPRTAAAVITDDNKWEKAEETGDLSYLDHLLLPEYRSISVDGSVYNKDAILAGAKKTSPERTAKIHAWLAAHPEKTSVVIIGDTAVLTFALDHAGRATMPIMSCDVFVYRNSHWRALYSQHTAAGK